jgi:hypothetical protein
MTLLPSSAATGAHDVDRAVRMGSHDPDVEDTHRGLQAMMTLGLVRHPTSSTAVRFREH